MTLHAVFQTPCEVYGTNDDLDPGATFTLSIMLDHADDRKLWVRVEKDAGATVEAVFALGKPHGLTLPGDPNERPDFSALPTAELVIDLETDATARQRFTDLGVAGLDLSLGARLDSVRIEIRAARDDGSWTADAPFFALRACWMLSGRAESETAILEHHDQDGTVEGTLSAGAKVDVRLCAGFSCVFPPDPDLSIGLPGFQFRLDLEAFGLSTGWLPFSWLDFGGFSDFHLNGLGKWFAGLVDGFSGEFNDIELPDWDLDLPIEIDLPLGLSFAERELTVTRYGGKYGLTARAANLRLRWQEQEIALPDTELVLAIKYDDDSPQDSTYLFRATLFKAQYPDAGQQDAFKFGLPFELLELSAACWRFRVGLYAAGQGEDRHFCFEALLEVGGLKVISELSSGGKVPLYNVRVLMRNFTVMWAELPQGVSQKLFDGVDGNAFDKYRQPIDAVSFATDLNEDASPANEYGLEFFAGDVRKGERFFVAWEQRGNQLLKALAHELLGAAPAGEVPDDAAVVQVALELAWFGEGEDQETQLRLDWSEVGDESKLSPGGTSPNPSQWTPVPAKKPVYDCVRWSDLGDQGLSLPVGSKGVDLRPIPDPWSFQLPVVSLELARPTARSVVLRREADDGTSVAFLLLYETKSAATGRPAAPIARAQIGFSLKQSGDGGERREVLETGPQEGEKEGPFLTVCMGYGGEGTTALRVIGWRKGEPPRFMQTYARDAHPIQALIPARNTGANYLGCPQPAPPPVAALPLSFDAFATPRFEGDKGWRLSMRFAAQKALFKMFGQGKDRPVKFEILRICVPREEDASHLLIETQLRVKFGVGSGEFEANGTVAFRFDPGDLSLSVEGEARLGFAKKPSKVVPAWAKKVPLPELPPSKTYAFSEEIPLFGLSATILSEEDEGKLPETIEFLVLSLDDGRFQLSLPEGKSMVVRSTELGEDGLSFWVERFEVGPGGLDLDARLVSSTLKVAGLDSPFALKQAGLRIRGNRIETLSIAASGTLPKILDEAPIDLAITFVQRRRGEAIVLDSLHCELGDEDSPVFSRGTRFKFEIQKLEISYLQPSPDHPKHFYFEVTGSAQFHPDEGEFESGLLEDLKSARVEFVKAPLTDDFTEHLRFSVELKEPKTYNVFNLFRMEIRSLGFHPHFEDFDDPGAAIIIGGQCEFADIGDVVSAEIDFHAMYIGLPEPGKALPQIYFDGLRVEISTPEGFRIAGRVDTYDGKTLDGFAGEGTVQIPGLPELSAAFAFVRLRRVETAPWERAWFISIEAAKISYQIAPLPIYLRQIGLGFGYRYTLPLVREFERKKTLAELIRTMMEALNSHQTLARIESWVPDPEHDRKDDEEDDYQRALWTIALEAVFTLGTTQSAPFDYDPRREQQLKTIFAQFLAAIRSDFTVVAAAKLWYPVSLDDFFEDVDGMRRRPLASGFMIYSAPQQRLLAHGAKGKNPYLGKPNDPVPDQLKAVLDATHYEATMLIEPSLLHAELGWPDRLMFRLEAGSLEIECRGGVLFRAENDLLIQGLYFSARGSVDLSGGVSLGFVGFRVSAHVDIHFATRLMTAIYLSRPLQSKLYAQVGLDLSVRFSVQAWLRIKIGFCKIKIDISFSIHLQIAVALELGWAGGTQLGFTARATVAIGVFGRSLRARVAVALNEPGVQRARRALAPYMSSFLEPGQIPPVPTGEIRAAPPQPAAFLSLEAHPERFVTSHVEAGEADGGNRRWLIWIMPAPASDLFYPPLRVPDPDVGPWVEYATLTLPKDLGGKVRCFDGKTWGEEHEGGDKISLMANPHRSMELTAESGERGTLNLQQLLAGCYRPVDSAKYTKPPGVKDEDKVEEYFPRYWPETVVPLELPADEPEAKLRDERVLRRGDPARSPRRRLDPRSDYDAALAASLEDEVGEGQLPDPEVLLEDQARGNQTFLLQSFYDDLVSLGSAALDDESYDRRPGSRPNVLDLGVVIAFDGEELPSWARSHSADAYPSIQFKKNVTSEIDEKPYPLRPVVDFDAVDFAKNPPVVLDRTSYFDEEVVALGWRLEWADPKAVSAAEKVDKDPEAFLRSYEVQFVDLSTNRRIRSFSVKPADLLAKTGEKGSKKLRRLRPRYQITTPTAELFPGGEAGGQRIRTVGATVTPIGQTGSAGTSFSFTLTEEPTLTPLPADDARLELEPASRGIGFRIELSWRELSLPTRPGVARTDYWRLVLRPLREVPMGAYPDDTADPTERGLMSATGQELMEGDVVIHLPYKEGRGPAAPTNERDPADAQYSLVIHPSNERGKGVFDWQVLFDGTHLFDHEGKSVERDSALWIDALSFFKGTSAADEGGRAFRLFLQAATSFGASDPKERAERVNLSGLAPVRLLLRQPDSDADVPRDTPDKRPLPHFEWPKAEDGAPVQVSGPVATSGPLFVPTLETSKDGHALLYVPEPGRSRAVTVEWSAVPGGSMRFEGVSEYLLYEARLDAMVNADNDPDSGFRPAWRQIARVLPSDAAVVRQSPDTMGDTQNWAAWTPAFAVTTRWMDHYQVDAKEMPRSRPGWYSWAESELIWPDPASEFQKQLLAERDNTDASPLDVLGAAPDETTAIQRLAAWRDLGEQAAGRRLHPYLCVLLGRLSMSDAAQGVPRYDLQASVGQPVTLTEPGKWLAANSEVLDPYGWAALSHLGLSATLALRDKRTGLVKDQDTLWAYLLKAIEAVNKEVAGIDAARHDLDEASDDEAEKAPEWLLLLKSHLAFERPIQTVAAMRARSAAAQLKNVSLAMLQISLRPFPHRVRHYSTLVFREKRKGERWDGEVELPNGIDVLFRRGHVKAGAKFKLEDEFRPGDRVLVRHHYPAGADADKSLRAALEKGVNPESSPLIGDNTFADKPLPLSRDGTPCKATPFGHFSADPNFWKRHFGLGENELNVNFERLADYLTTAFASEENAKKPPALPTKKQLEKLMLLYLSWSARFFASAPIRDELPQLRREDGSYDPPLPVLTCVSVAAPIVSDPVRIAPDPQRLLRFSRRIDEEWASTRSYAIQAVYRYARLNSALAGERRASPQPLLGDGTKRADAQLGRVRRVEPPQLLGQRALRDAEGRWFHEVTLAAHAEELLANSNVHLERKLDFGEVMRKYARRFRHQDWIERLRDAKVFCKGGEPEPPTSAKPGTSSLEQRPDLAESQLDFLAHAPKARWGASRHVTASEPFYYEQVLHYRASAAAELSEEKVLPLSLPEPGDVRPRGDDEPVSRIDASWAVLPGERSKLYKAWLDELPIDVRSHLSPLGWELCIRVPRLFESLPHASLDGHFAAEEAKRGFGRLPDPDIVLQIAASAGGTTETLATIVAVLAGEGAPFQLNPVAGLYHFGKLRKEEGDWGEGIQLRLAVAPARKQSVDFAVDETSLPVAPVTLVALGSALLGDAELQSDGPLARLAPLALRLEVVEEDDAGEMVLHNPLRGPRWLTRPHLDPASEPAQLPANVADLALGIRLLLDVERRRAAGLVAFDLRRASGQHSAPLRDLLRAVELAAACYATEPTVLSGLDQARIEELAALGIVLWRRSGSDQQPPVWNRVDAPLGEVDPTPVLIVADGSGEAQAWPKEFDEVVKRFGDDQNRPSAAAALVKLSKKAEALAEAAHLKRDPAPPDVYWQRGRAPRQRWAKEPDDGN